MIIPNNSQIISLKAAFAALQEEVCAVHNLQANGFQNAYNQLDFEGVGRHWHYRLNNVLYPLWLPLAIRIAHPYPVTQPDSVSARTIGLGDSAKKSGLIKNPLKLIGEFAYFLRDYKLSHWLKKGPDPDLSEIDSGGVRNLGAVEEVALLSSVILCEDRNWDSSLADRMRECLNEQGTSEELSDPNKEKKLETKRLTEIFIRIRGIGFKPESVVDSENRFHRIHSWQNTGNGWSFDEYLHNALLGKPTLQFGKPSMKEIRYGIVPRVVHYQSQAISIRQIALCQCADCRSQEAVNRMVTYDSKCPQTREWAELDPKKQNYAFFSDDGFEACELRQCSTCGSVRLFSRETVLDHVRSLASFAQRVGVEKAWFEENYKDELSRIERPCSDVPPIQCHHCNAPTPKKFPAKDTWKEKATVYRPKRIWLVAKEDCDRTPNLDAKMDAKTVEEKLRKLASDVAQSPLVRILAQYYLAIKNDNQEQMQEFEMQKKQWSSDDCENALKTLQTLVR